MGFSHIKRSRQLTDWVVSLAPFLSVQKKYKYKYEYKYKYIYKYKYKYKYQYKYMEEWASAT